MSGRCYACGNEFKSFFSGEKGCENCGFEFCKKCITKKIANPKEKNKKLHVCDKCFLLLSSGKKNAKENPPSPPKAFVKRMEELERKERQRTGETSAGDLTAPSPVTSQKATKQKYAGMEREDADLMRRLDQLKEEREKNAKRPDEQEIASRLAGLRADRPEPPTEQEMRDKLAALQGRTPQQAAAQAAPHVSVSDKRSHDEQIVDLMDELFDEHQIEMRQRGCDDVTKPDSDPSLHLPGGAGTSSGTGPDDDISNLRQINLLIANSARELEMDAQKAIDSINRDKELMSRLKTLKNDTQNKDGADDMTGVAGVAGVAGATDDSDTEASDDEQSADMIIKQYLEETKLEESLSRETTDHVDSIDKPSGKVPDTYKVENGVGDSEGGSEEELLLCCICNDEAKIKCNDCDEDVYCLPCFGEGHKDAATKDHDFERYPKRRH